MKAETKTVSAFVFCDSDDVFGFTLEKKYISAPCFLLPETATKYSFL